MSSLSLPSRFLVWFLLRVDKLVQIFSAAEIELMLCGERVIEWDKASLEQHFKLVSNEQGDAWG